MTTKLKCPECHGNKLVMGAGYIEHKCTTCNGLGYIDDPKPTNILPEIKSHVLPTPKPLLASIKVKIPSMDTPAKEVGERVQAAIDKHIQQKLDKRSKAYRESIGRK